LPSDGGKDKSRTKEKKEKEKPQQGSPSKADADAKSDGLEVKEAKAAAHVPALERRPRRRSVLEETPSKYVMRGVVACMGLTPTPDWL